MALSKRTYTIPQVSGDAAGLATAFFGGILLNVGLFEQEMLVAYIAIFHVAIAIVLITAFGKRKDDLAYRIISWVGIGMAGIMALLILIQLLNLPVLGFTAV